MKIRLQGQMDTTTTSLSVRAIVRSIVHHNGIVGLWKGVVPSMQRAALLTATQIASYDHSKQMVLNSGVVHEGILLHMGCSMLAGLLTATITSPVDVIKTRVMNQTSNSLLKYTGTVAATREIIHIEGLSGLYKGWFPNWMRIGPHTIVAFLIYEQLRISMGLPPV